MAKTKNEEPVQEVTFQIQKRMREGGIYSLCFSEQRRHGHRDTVSHGCVHLTQNGSAPETLRPVVSNRHRVFREKTHFQRFQPDKDLESK